MKKCMNMLLILAMTATLVACGNKENTETKKLAALPTVTSAEVGCYITTGENGAKSVVDLSGKAMTGYTVDKEGNVVNAENVITVAADKAAEYVYVTGISFNQSDVTAAPGTDVDLTVTVEPDNATNKTYTVVSDNPDAVQVDGQNKVTATADGEATVTATAPAGKDGAVTATAKVTVKTEAAPEEKPAVSAPSTNVSHSESTSNTSESVSAPATGGSTSTATETAPTVHKHQWKEVCGTKTIDVYETQMRMICSACGMDITDMSTAERTAHDKAHVFSGSEKSGWYEKPVQVKVGTKEVQYTDHFVCTICGATNYDLSHYPD
ncbi:MAG: Ig-like domain-containing protein [Oscillibacter sp.]|nr:Ig-like domain-containing protein [Oscillibacter sp.]